MQLSLNGKTALICGSSQGIGKAIADELAQLGANCILLARNRTALELVLSQLQQSDEQLHDIAVADFTHLAEVQAAIAAILEKSTVHILINNTGGPPAGPIAAAQPPDFVQAFQQHLLVNHLLTQAVVPGMKEAAYGRIINIISTSVKIPLPNLGVSNTIRGAVAAWAKTMANELGPFNITVNNVLPGFTETQRLQKLVHHTALQFDADDASIAAALQKEVPLHRFGQPEEIAAVAAFLASPAASYVNGASIPVDGGRTGSI